MFGIKKQQLVTDEIVIRKAIERRLEKDGIFPNKEEAIKTLQSRSLKVYLGIDPTGPDIHLGHSIPLLFLKQLWELGHTPVILIGDFTARIGDPTGKDVTRKSLSEDQINQNMANYLVQIGRILPKGSFEIRYNNSWLSKLNFKDIVKLASHVTVQQMIQRDMFQDRISNQRPIGLHEFLYPLMQGYDSVAMEIDGEVGGNDQTFNMLVGRDLEKKFLNKEKLVFATRLLVDAASGKKMSKTEGELIAFGDKPQEIRRKVLALDDKMIRTVAELCTEKSYEWIDERQPEGELPKDARAFKEEISDELVKMFCGEAFVSSSREATEVGMGEINTLAAVLKASGLASSMSVGKNLIDQGAVEVNDTIIKEWNFEVKSGDKIRVGKGKFVEIK